MAFSLRPARVIRRRFYQVFSLTLILFSAELFTVFILHYSANHRENHSESLNKLVQRQRHRHVRSQCKRLLAERYKKSNPNNPLNHTSVWETGWFSEQRLQAELYSNIIVNDRYKILYCNVPKVACTNLKRLMAVLEGLVRPQDIDKITHYDMYFGEKYNLKFRKLSHYPISEMEKRLNGYTSFMYVRHPLERLLSLYRDKFVNIRNNVSDFTTSIGREVMARYRVNASTREIRSGRVTFAEFLQYVVDTEDEREDNEHWETYYDHCQPCLLDYDFIGKYETFATDSRELLHLLDISEVNSVPTVDAFSMGRTAHVMEDYFYSVPTHLYKQLLHKYTIDFELYNYFPPNSIH